MHGRSDLLGSCIRAVVKCGMSLGGYLRRAIPSHWLVKFLRWRSGVIYFGRAEILRRYLKPTMGKGAFSGLSPPGSLHGFPVPCEVVPVV